MAKKKTGTKISNIALIAVLILIFAYFLLYGIRNVTVCNNIKTDELKEYQGNVELKRKIGQGILFTLSSSITEIQFVSIPICWRVARIWSSMSNCQSDTLNPSTDSREHTP